MSRRYLPVAGEGPWLAAARRSPDLPRQGWKIHVSATVLNLSGVLAAIGPTLVREQVVFKGIRSIAELRKLNCGLYYGYSQIGKAFTIYPESAASLVDLAGELARLLAGQPGPTVPFETRIVDDCPVFVRYGLFTGGSTLQGPDGEEEDRRDRNPDWAQPPRGLVPDRPPRVAGPLSTSYRAYGFISQRGKGGVYRAVDLAAVPARPCVLKEGRRHGETDVDGHDGYSRVCQEAETLGELAARDVPVPGLYASFEQAGNKYLVLEWMPRGSLAEVILADDAEPLTLADALGLCAQVARVVEQVHRSGWVWRDLKTPNLLVDEEMRLRPIDFEGAARRGSTVTSPWGSPGHVPPEWATARRASVAQDKFALGVVMRQILTGEPLGEAQPRPLRHLYDGLPPAVERLVAALGHPQAARRPSAAAAARIVERAIDAQGQGLRAIADQ